MTTSIVRGVRPGEGAGPCEHTGEVSPRLFAGPGDQPDRFKGCSIQREARQCGHLHVRGMGRSTMVNKADVVDGSL